MVRSQAKEGCRKSFTCCFGFFYGKTKFEMTWNIVKNGTAKPEIKHIKNISRGHQFEDDAMAQFESISKCKITRCRFYHF